MIIENYYEIIFVEKEKDIWKTNLNIMVSNVTNMDYSLTIELDCRRRKILLKKSP